MWVSCCRLYSNNRIPLLLWLLIHPFTNTPIIVVQPWVIPTIIHKNIIPPSTTITTTSFTRFRDTFIQSCYFTSRSNLRNTDFYRSFVTPNPHQPYRCSGSWTKCSMRMKRKGRTSAIALTETIIDSNRSNDTISSSTKRRRSSRLLLQTSSSNNRSLDHFVDEDPTTNTSTATLMNDNIPTRTTATTTTTTSSNRNPSPPPILLFPDHRQQKSLVNAVSITSNNDITTTSDSQSLLLLHNWIHHTDISFHYFTPSEVQQIQTKLLQWYSIHRRKLPWRGDPPPWNGSTANFISSSSTTSSSTMSKSTTRKTKKTTNRTSNVKVEVANTTNTTTPDASKDDSYLHRTYPITTYGIWVSEIMLQQTRVEAVIVKWCQFISAFPTVTALANANIESVNAIWAGLGYYRRLKLLHTAAQMVVTQYHGIIPTTIEGLLTLPGIGRYTAHAIASIAYHQNVPVVDGNVCRVLSRLRGVTQTIKATTFKDQYGWTLAQQLVSGVDQNTGCNRSWNVTTQQVTSSDLDRTIPTAITPDMTAVRAGDINQALMELGATYCAPSGTGIHPDDPLKEFYWSTKLGMALASAIHIKNNDDDTGSLLDTASMIANDDDGQPHCQLCAKNGIQDIISQFRSQLKESKLQLPNDDPVGANCSVHSNYHDVVQMLGHSLFPLPPPKVNKKEEVVVIAAICRICNDSDIDSYGTKQWLLMKRQDDGGLLSGQWEFPSICVWQSEDAQTSKRNGASGRRSTPRVDMSDRVPLISVSQRRKHIHTLLLKLGNHANSRVFQTITDEPIHHIFSHIRHTMYIEYACMDSDWTFSDDDTREQLVKWKSQSDMDQVGITSGVKKVLRTIEKKLGKNLMV